MRFNNRFKNVSLRGVVCRGNLIIFALLLLSSLFFVTPVFATPTVTDVTSVAVSGQGILPNSPPTALLRVEITFVPGDALTSMEAVVNNYSGTVLGDVSELAIYSDTNNNGIFDSDDTRIAYKTDPVLGTAYGGITTPWSPVFTSETHDGAIWFYFIVIKTSGTIDHAGAFQGQLIGITGSPGGSPGTFSGTTSNIVRCECKVVDIYYTESDTNLFQTWDLVSGDTETYWQPNYLSNHSIDQEMTEPNETILAGTPHRYYLSESSQAKRYSFLDGTEDDTNTKAAHSDSLKFERRRKLMGMNVKTPVLGIKVAGNNQFQDATYYDTDFFDTMVITFTDTLRPDTANFDPETMLFSVIPDSEAISGVAVYQDTNQNGVFDEGVDQVLKIGSSSWSAWSGDQKTLTLNFSLPASNPQAAIPRLFNADLDDNTGHDTTGVDFFVVLRGDPDAIAYGADFTVQVTGMSFIGAKPPDGNFTSYETEEIKAVFELSDYTGTRVDPGTTFPVIGINVNKGDAGVTETPESFILYLKKTDTNFDPSDDLIASGVTVLDRATGDTVPVVLSSWSTVSYQGEDWWATTVVFNSAETIPNDDTGVDSGPDYLINLTTSSSFGYDKKIIAAIPDNGFHFGSGKISASGTALITNANVDHGSNERVYPDIDPSAPIHNPVLGNPSVIFSQTSSSVKINSDPTQIIRIDLASNTTADTQPVLKSIVVQIIPANSGFTYTDLADMDTDPALSGIGLYTSGGTPIELAFKPSPDFSRPSVENYRRYLLVLKDPLPLPQSLDVTIKTSRTISSGDAMSARVWGSEVTPCSSYGLGFRVKDESGTDTAVETRQGTYLAYGAVVFDQDTLTLDTPLGGLDTDYDNNWYLVIVEGGDDAVGRIYKVTGVADAATSTPDVTVEGVDLNTIGTVSAVKFFKVESTSYQNFTTPASVVCSGVYNPSLDIVQPSLPGETPTGSQYTIQYDAYAATGTTLALYRVEDSDYPDTANRVLIASGLSAGAGQTYVWDTKLVPPETYYVYGILGSAGNLDTAYSVGTVTITNSPPTADSLTITPSPVGNSGSITLADIADADSNVLTVTFYSTDDTGLDTITITGGTVNPPYPTDLTVSWNTSLVAAGDRLLYAMIDDAVNDSVLFPSGGTAFTVNHPPGIAITQPSSSAEKALYQQYTVYWTAAGLDSEGETIDLYYDTDNILGGETLIASGLSADTASDSYIWHTDSVANGTYYVKGIIQDGVWPDSYSYSAGTVDVKDYVSPDTTIHIIEPAADILLDGATDTMLYPSSPPVISRGQVLAPFLASDNIRWFDTWVQGEWDPAHDALWLDADGDGLYNGLPLDTLLAGVAPTAGSSGTRLTSLNPFAYYDVNSSAQWNVGEAIIYEGGEGNRRFYYSDPIVHITWDTTPPGANAPTATYLVLYREKSGVLEQINTDTVVDVGESLTGSFDYDFSELTISQHGLYHLILRAIDPNGWYTTISSTAPGAVTVNSAPNISITRPVLDADIWSGYPYNLTYIATDPDSDAFFNLYAYDAATADTYPIVGPLTDADGSDSYLWYASLDASIPRDTYLNIRGVISDGTWLDTTQAAGRLRILATAPSVLLAADSTETVITLTWTDNTQVGETKTYTIWRQDTTAADSPLVMIEGPSESALPEPVLIDPATNTWQYDDNDITLDNDHVYYYYVVVNITEGGNAYVFNSNTVSAMLLAFNQSPIDLDVVPGRLTADLSWSWVNGASLLEDGFSIERRVHGATTFTVIGTKTGNDTTFGLYTDSAYTDSMLRQQGRLWQYRVRAFKVYTNGNTGYSRYSSIEEREIMPLLDSTSLGSGSGAGGGGAVGPLAVGISALLGWWKRRKRKQ